MQLLLQLSDRLLHRSRFGQVLLHVSIADRPIPVINTGKERLAKDAKADDDWRGKVDFYVKGVDGKIPAGK